MVKQRHITQKQFEVIQQCLTSKRVVLMPSRRSGKSTINMFVCDIEAQTTPNYVSYYFGLTTSHIKKTVYYNFMEIAGKENLNLRECKLSNGELQIAYKNGAKIYFSGTGNMNSFRGDKAHRFIIDEIQDQSEEFLQKVIEPMLLDYDAKIIISGTIKGLDCWVNDYENRGDWEVIKYNTYEAGLIPHHVLDEAKKNMSPDAFAQEILGEPIPATGLVYKDFTKENIVSVGFNPDLPCYISFDFNVNPMTALAIQQNVDMSKQYFVVKEFYLDNSNTRMTADVIIDYLRQNNFNSYVVLTGDYTGKARDTTSDYTDWQILEQKFSIYRSNVEQFLALSRCVSKKRRYNLTNNAFFMKNLMINKDCKYLIRELNRFEYKSDGIHADTKGDSMGHITDSLSYFPYNFLQIEYQF